MERIPPHEVPGRAFHQARQEALRGVPLCPHCDEPLLPDEPISMVWGAGSPVPPTEGAKSACNSADRCYSQGRAA